MSVHQSSHPVTEAHLSNARLPKYTYPPQHAPILTSRQTTHRRRVTAASSESQIAETPRSSWNTLPLRHVLESQQFDKVNPFLCMGWLV